MTLVEFMVALGSDPAFMAAFMADPQAAAGKAGLSAAETELLLSGDVARIEAAVEPPDGSTIQSNQTTIYITSA